MSYVFSKSFISLNGEQLFALPFLDKRDYLSNSLAVCLIS